MTKYENDSQLLFLTSEANFSNNGIGNQNHFKVNLADSPLKNNDSSLIKLSVKELKLRKSWYNINETNNRVRMSLQGYSTADGDAVVIPNIGTILKIPPGDYLTHESLVTAFSGLVKQTLVDATLSSATKILTTNLTITINTAVYKSNTKEADSGKLNPSASTSRNGYRLAFELSCDITNFRWTNTPIFQFLNIPIAKTCTLNVTGGSNLEENDRFNDSYILLGGPRVEEFQGTIANPIWSLSSYDESLSVKVKTGAQRVLTIASWFPMSESLHTLDDVYVLSRQSRSQASSSLQSTTIEHAHNFIASNLIAKASRDVPNSVNDIGVYFRITQPSYFFSVLTQPFINEVEFELKDHRGRDLPYNKTTTPPVGYLATNIKEYTGPPQVESGNSVVSLVVLAEKYIGDSPSSLQGFPDPAGIYNPKFRSNITMPNKFC